MKNIICLLFLGSVFLTQSVYSMEYGKFPEKKKQIESLPPLHKAILDRDVNEVTNLLTTPTISPNASFNGILPIFLAANFDSDEHSKSCEIVKKLIEKKADINRFYSMNYSDLLNPLQLAAIRGNKELVSLLLSKAVWVDEVNNDGYSALHYAAYYGHKEIVQQLLSAGAKRTVLTDIKNKKKLQLHFLAFELALHHKHNDTASLIVNWPNSFGGLLIHEAVDTKQIEYSSLVKILNFTLNPHRKIHEDFTLLHCAMKCKDVAIAQLLIDNNAPINCFTNKGTSPLGIALEKKFYEIAELLLKNGAQINNNEHKEFLLHNACRQGLTNFVELLVSYNAEVNQLDNEGDTPLLISVKNNSVEPTEVLLSSQKADVNVPDCEGAYPIHYACAQGNEEMVRLLLRYNEKNLVNGKGEKPISLIPSTNKALFRLMRKLFGLPLNYFVQAVKTLNWEAIIDCLHFGFTEDHLPVEQQDILCKAVIHANYETIKNLLYCRVNCNSKDYGSYSPLLTAIDLGLLEVVKLLLHYKADVHYVDSCGNSSLFFLKEERNGKEIFDLLITHNADFNHRNNSGLTPFLSYCYRDELSIIKVFLESSVSNQVINQIVLDTGNSALHYACKRNAEMVKLLIKHGIKYVKNNSDCYPFDFISLHNLASISTLRTSKLLKGGSTLLHQAIINDSAKYVFDLIDESNCNMQNDEGGTPLHLAIKFKQDDHAQWLINYAYTDLSIKNFHGQTALNCACTIENEKLIIALLEANAGVDPVNIL